jgi:DNA-binding HxlR family transcriptional regulator
VTKRPLVVHNGGQNVTDYPPPGDHDVTALGGSLLEVVAGVKRWAESHMDQVLEARASYDAQP